MNIYIYIYKTQAMHMLSEPRVNYVILWENRDLQFIKKIDSQFIQNRAALVYMLFISLLHIIH